MKRILWLSYGATVRMHCYLWVIFALTYSLPAFSQSLLTMTLEMQDGRFIPETMTVPAGQKIKIILHNTGTSAAEFESFVLRKEKVLAPGAQSFIVIAPLKAGTYHFFDDFHLNMPQGVIIAQ